MPAAPLKLIAQDADGLAAVSAHLQDAIGRVADTHFDRRGRRFALALNRFRWEDRIAARTPGPPQRQRAMLLIADVSRVRSRQVNREDPDSLLVLLAMTFTPEAEAGGPGGTLRLALAGGAEIALDVDAIEVSLRDEGLPWNAQSTPRHG